tara:strand:+ start:472 stop:900 length:429 start_codon:yes stop_codon:yes gene_type:complete
MVNEIVQQIFVPNLSENSDFILNTVCNRLYDIISGNVSNDVEHYNDMSGTNITIVYKLSPIKKYFKSKRVLLSHLKSYTKVKKDDKLLVNKKTCLICLNLYKEGEYKRCLPCNHTYHKRCIDEWLIRCKKMSCPLCRKSHII